VKVCIIGGTGHIGSFLVPQLVKDAHEVTVVTRGARPQATAAAWRKVTFVKSDYKRGEKAFFAGVADLGAEVVIDILGKDLPGLYEAVKPRARHLIACGSVWMLGPPRVVPTPPETQNPCPFEWYATRWKELLATKERAKRDGLAFTAVLPPNICGPGKVPLEARGGRDVQVHLSHSRGEPVYLPENCNTLIAPSDASDVAKVFTLAALNRDAASDEIFNACAPYALTAPRFIEAYGEIYGTRIPIEYVSGEKFYGEILPDEGANYHFRAHMAPDISKTRAKLGYEPEFTSEESMSRAVAWMHEQKLI
jgi:nucleoside-diphosphate-sugar epimerase